MSKIVIALDYPEAAPALKLASTLKNRGLWMKVGLELFSQAGPDLIHALKDMDYPVFLDLKFHDIPNTVQGATANAARLGVNLTTIHICGGEAMVKAALAGAQAGAPGGVSAQAGAKNSQSSLTILGVTVLTSQASTDLQAEAQALGCSENQPNPATVALARAKNAHSWGLKGIVCSAHETSAIKQACGSNFICLTPGIRMPGGELQDQKRVMTPAQAVAAGSDFLVIGRAITAAPNPIEAIEKIFANIAE